MHAGDADAVAGDADVADETLVACGVDTCFTNPGTSEMHFVAALDRVEGMRCVLGLFEGVVTGAADGYYRMADRPASTLLEISRLVHPDMVVEIEAVGILGAGD